MAKCDACQLWIHFERVAVRVDALELVEPSRVESFQHMAQKHGRRFDAVHVVDVHSAIPAAGYQWMSHVLSLQHSTHVGSPVNGRRAVQCMVFVEFDAIVLDKGIAQAYVSKLV